MQLMDMKQSIAEKQAEVDEMEIQLMGSAPESVPFVVQVREDLEKLNEEVVHTFFLLIWDEIDLLIVQSI